MLRRLLATLILSIAVSGTAIAATQTPAQAAWGSCNPGWVCLYPGLNGTGVPWIYYVPDSGYGCKYLGQGSTEIADSVWNRAGETIWLTDHSDCSGWQYSVLNGGKVGDLGAYKNDTSGVLWI